MSQISVIIVSWNARGYLRGCLTSIRQTRGDLVREIIVVDNASEDGSPDMVAQEFPEATLIRSDKNLGFARANNLGLAQVSGEWVGLINSDVVLHIGCFERMLNHLQKRRDVGLAGPQIIGGDGRVQLTCRRLPTLWNVGCCVLGLDRLLSRWSLFSGFEMRHWDYTRQGEVEVLSGCFWLARRTAIQQVGGLDERFFFYAEDVDWCKRLHDAGWKLLFISEATATHYGGGSSSNAPLRYSIEMLRANLVYWKKHHGHLGSLFYYLLSLLYHGIRFVARVSKRIFVKAQAENIKIREHFICLRWLLTGRGV